MDKSNRDFKSMLSKITEAVVSGGVNPTPDGGARLS